jgi:nucleotide-binding universal stress UspA family protein
MFRSILVPLDGSPFGEQALPLALTVARRAGASVRLVHVHVPLSLALAEGGVAFDQALDQQSRAREREYLDTVTRRVAELADVRVTSALADSPVADGLLMEAMAAGSDLVVMTTHGRGPLARFWLGSVADELVRRMPLPLLLVRPREKAPGLAAEHPLRHVLIPLDGSPLAETILEPAVALGGADGVAYTLLRLVLPAVAGRTPMADLASAAVDPTLVAQLAEWHEQEKAAAGRYLQGIKLRLALPPEHVQTVVTSSDQPAVAILDEARQRSADLVALATHGRGGLARLLLGSVADKVLRGSTGPVLVYHPQASR